LRNALDSEASGHHPEVRQESPRQLSPILIMIAVGGLSLALAATVYFLLTFNKFVY
jgi:hypothetical protein